MIRPAARAVRRARRQPSLTIIGWHRLDDVPGGLSTPTEVFRGQLEALADWGARVLPLEHCNVGQAKGTLPARAVALTFDDGYASILDAAWPLLKDRGLPATLFVVSGYVDGRRRFPWDAKHADAQHTRLSDIDDILQAADEGLTIGSHTVTHRWLPGLDMADLHEEMVGSRAALERELGRHVRSIAYPMGGWNRAVRDAAAIAGYRIGVTVDRGVNSPRRDPLALRRSVAPRTVEDFELMLDGAYTWLRPVDRWRSRRVSP
jgi:peptidoglycan/xylan/chitin deacetylase (PgdA/CDA1 family)